MPALFCKGEEMTAESYYTTNLAKAQGMVTETLELLEIWEPGMAVGELKSRGYRHLASSYACIWS